MEAVVAIWPRNLSVINKNDLVKRVLDNQQNKKDDFIGKIVDRNLIQDRLYSKCKNINFRKNSFYLYKIKIGIIVENYVVVIKTREPIIDVYV